MGTEQENPATAGAGTSAAASGAMNTAGTSAQTSAAPPPPQPYLPQSAPAGYTGPPPLGYPGSTAPAPHAQAYAAPPNYYATAAPAVVEGRPPLVSIISPEDQKKIRKMQWINFACTMVQLLCSLAIILLVRNNLTSLSAVTSGSRIVGLDFDCFAATPAHPNTCEYAYSLASVSIFFCFILSLMQCLTMDCCGMGRAVEAGFDAAACAWWIAGGITLGMRASEANAMGVRQSGARNAVVALCWISAALFLALLVTNVVLIKRLGRAYKAAAQQLQQHMTAYPVAQTQMVHMGGQHPHHGAPGAYGAPQGGLPYPPQPGVQPAGYPPAGGAGAPAGYPPQQQQWAPGYPTSPPNAGTSGPNAV